MRSKGTGVGTSRKEAGAALELSSACLAGATGLSCQGWEDFFLNASVSFVMCFLRP